MSIIIFENRPKLSLPRENGLRRTNRNGWRLTEVGRRLLSINERRATMVTNHDTSREVDSG